MSRARTGFWFWGVLLAFFAAIAACTTQREDRIVAQVGEERIRVGQLRQFIANLPEYAKQDSTAEEEAGRHLQTMINIELLVMEARAAALDQSPEFQVQMKRIRRQRLVDLFVDRTLVIEEEVTEGEVREYAERMGLDRAIRFADIMVPDRESALAVFDQLKTGVPFAQVAQKWSVNKNTSSQGGDLGGYTTKEQMIKPLQDKLFSLAVGQVSKPLMIGGQYSIFTVLADSAVELGPEKTLAIQMGLKQEKADRARSALADGLAQKYHLELARAGLDLFVEKVRGGAPLATGEERNIVLYRHDGGEITAWDLVEAASNQKGKVLAGLTEPDLVIAFAEDHVVPNAMLVEAARRAGIDVEEETVVWLENQSKQLMVTALRARVLRAKVTIAENELRQFYQTHSERYLHPEQIEVQEILVATEAEARQLMEQIQQGASLDDLARKHSIRSTEERDEEGRFHFHLFEKAFFGGFIEAAEIAEIGVLSGPAEVDGGYSIFKVLSRERKRETYEEAEWRVRSQLKREKYKKAFNQFVEELRTKHEAEVVVWEEHLAAAFAEN